MKYTELQKTLNEHFDLQIFIELEKEKEKYIVLFVENQNFKDFLDKFRKVLNKNNLSIAKIYDDKEYDFIETVIVGDMFINDIGYFPNTLYNIRNNHFYMKINDLPNLINEYIKLLRLGYSFSDNYVIINNDFYVEFWN